MSLTLVDLSNRPDPARCGHADRADSRARIAICPRACRSATKQAISSWKPARRIKRIVALKKPTATMRPPVYGRSVSVAADLASCR